MLLMIDNYDSFTFNLVQYFTELGQEVVIKRNDAISIKEIKALSPDYLVISPGPCTPDQSGISLDAVKEFSGTIPILGVCLGLQAMAQVFGGKIIKAPEVVHGYTSDIHHKGEGVFHNLPTPFKATRYHSLVVEKSSLADCFEITAWAEYEDENAEINHLIMGIRHKELPIEGIQFHPESILTEHGHKLLGNFLSRVMHNHSLATDVDMAHLLK